MTTHSNRTMPPTVHPDHSGLLGSQRECDICGEVSRNDDGSDGRTIEFLYPRKLVCEGCAQTIAAAATRKLVNGEPTTVGDTPDRRQREGRI